MCGIAGVFDPTSPPSDDTLSAMAERLTHRGPDDEGYYRDGPIGFGHRRLGVIDLDAGPQPVFSEDGSVAVIFNGEIYNYRTLRSQLTEKGHSFSTRTDTEVLVHLYEERGTRFVDSLEGMYSFALWDADAERLVLARDPLGIKPMVVGAADDRLVFASELPAVLEAPIDHGGLDRKALAQYFAFGFIPAPRTVFGNVRKLRPGERLVVTPENRESRVATGLSVTPRDPGLASAADELRSRVDDAVEARLQSDVPLGAFLSGGLDSSAIVATMSGLLDDPVRTFTVSFDEAQFDETWAASEVAAYHDTDHTEFTVGPDDVRSLVPTVVDRLGEPFADQSLVPTYVVARETADDVTVALSGDGADELFAGYDKYRGEYLSRYYRAVPEPVRRTLLEPAVHRLPASRSGRLGEFFRQVRKFTRGGEPDVPARHFGWLRILDEEARPAVAALDPLETGNRTVADWHDDASDLLPAGRRDALARMQTVDVMHSLPDQMLRKVDQASMFNALEVRTPFLARNIVEYALSLPTSYKLTGRERKRVLKRAFADRLPSSILERSKQGFDMPIGEWFKSSLAGEFEEAVTNLRTDLIDTSAVRDVYAEHCRGKRDYGKFLWSVYVFARWEQRMHDMGVLGD